MTKRFNYHYDGFGAYYLCDKEEGTYEEGIIGEIWADKSDMTDLVNLLNKLNDENEELRKAVDNCQFRTLDLLDYIKEKGTVTHQEIKDWWNSEVMK